MNALRFYVKIFFKCAMYTKYANNMKLLRELLPGDSLSYEIMTPSLIDDIKRSSQLRKLLKRVIVNRT